VGAAGAGVAGGGRDLVGVGGWGALAGFGLVHPLPGIIDRFELNSAITLPIGVEAYAAYALGTWLSLRPMPDRARRFAAWSSMSSLGLGLLGQVIYHLLTAAHQDKAPTPVVVFVACLPVLVLGAGATLHHLLGEPALAALAPTRHDRPVTVGAGEAAAMLPAPAWDGQWLAADPLGRPDEGGASAVGVGGVGVDVTELLEPGRAVAAQLEHDGQRLTRRALIEGLRARGLSCSTDRATALLGALRVERADHRADHIGRLEAVAG
jgi:hypothetical protein